MLRNDGTALLAISREPFELCPHFKSLSSIARRELSIDLRWPASKLETQNPPLRSDPRIGHILGEGGGNTEGTTTVQLYYMYIYHSTGRRVGVHRAAGGRIALLPLQHYYRSVL